MSHQPCPLDGSEAPRPRGNLTSAHGGGRDGIGICYDSPQMSWLYLAVRASIIA